MATLEHGELQVVVPVGFLLAEPWEGTVSVARPGGDPLPVRLRLIPARASEGFAAVPEPVLVSTPMLSIPFPTRRAKPTDLDADYTEYGGGD